MRVVDLRPLRDAPIGAVRGLARRVMVTVVALGTIAFLPPIFGAGSDEVHISPDDGFYRGQLPLDIADLPQLSLPARQPNGRLPGVPWDETDWGAIIDATWGECSLTVEERLETFDDFWTYADVSFASFTNLDIDWQAIRDRYEPEILAEISHGRFAGILSAMGQALSEPHTRIVYGQAPYEPGYPMLRAGGLISVGAFGAGLTPLPDGSLLAYEVTEGHPLGIEPGDVVLGYEGHPWKRIYEDLLAAELPVSRGGLYWGGSPKAYEHLWLIAAGINWYLFDSIDVLKRDTGIVQRLPLTLMDTLVSGLHVSEQLRLPGVDRPFDVLEANTWGVIEGTSIGYIYLCSGWGTDGQAFADAVSSMMFTTEGLIIDLRWHNGGYLDATLPGLEMLFGEEVTTLKFWVRCGPDDHFALCPSASWPDDVIEGNPLVFYNKPIAVISGRGSFSMGEIELLRLQRHPMVKTFGKPPPASASSMSGFGGYPGGTVFAVTNVVVSLADDPTNAPLTHLEFPIDCPVWFTQDDVAEGRDTVSETAIAWIQGTLTDIDDDGVEDPCDNCVDISNQDQIDTDRDGAGNACDCAVDDPARSPGALESNDGVDNQCPGDSGYGMVDELSRLVAFRNMDEKNELSWFGQDKARTYEIARSSTPGFTGSCELIVTPTTYWIDADDPPPGEVQHYLVRAVAPNAGSWGQNSLGVERLPGCH